MVSHNHSTLQRCLHRVPTAVPLALLLHHTRGNAAVFGRLRDVHTEEVEPAQPCSVSEKGKRQIWLQVVWRQQPGAAWGALTELAGTVSACNTVWISETRPSSSGLLFSRVEVPLWRESTQSEGMEPVWIQPKGFCSSTVRAGPASNIEGCQSLSIGEAQVYKKALAPPLHLCCDLLQRWQLTTHPMGKRHPCSLQIQLPH